MADRHTLVHQLRDWAKRTPDKGALFAMNDAGFWDKTTWAEYARQVELTARGLIARFQSDPQSTQLYEADDAEEDMYCMGPDIGA